MVTDPPFDDEVTSPDDFRVALRSLPFVALENDIDPRGAWEYRIDGAISDWEVMMVRLESDSTPE